jgi:SagB-type dehydrogenase family enzyme
MNRKWTILNDLSMSTIIPLARPNQDGFMSLERAMSSRRSHRDFSPQALSLEQIGQLAFAAQGREPGGKYRTAPSAGATYPLELFLVTGDGLFHYLPEDHALEKRADEDLRGRLASAAWGQEFVGAAPLTLVFAAEYSRATHRYGQRGVRYVYMEAGHAAQNVHLQAEALGLGSVAVGAFDDASVADVLSLPEYLEPVYMVAVGYCR